MKIIGIDDPEEKVKKINNKKVALISGISIILIIFIILFGFYLGNKEFRNFIDKYILMKNVTENNVASIELNESENNYVYAYDKYIALLNQNNLVGYNTSGNKEYELKVEISNPLVDTNNRFLLIAEKGKQKIYLISGNDISWEKELNGNINRISVNKNGYVSVILTGTTHKSIILTFDEKGNELFTTYLANSSAIDSDISHDNKYLSFIEVSTNGTSIQSIIKTISIQKAKETPSESIISAIKYENDSVPLNLKYQDGNRLICMYDNSISQIKDGQYEKIISLKEDGKNITYAGVELDSFGFRVIEKNILLSTETTVEIVNTSNKKTNNYVFDGVIKEVYSYDNLIALNLGSEVHFIRTNGWLDKKYISSKEIKNIVMSSNFSAIIYKDKIEIVEL